MPTNQMTLREAPKLPGLATAAEIALTFMIEDQGFGRPVLLDRLPSAIERDVMRARLVEFEVMLRPAASDAGDQAKARAAIAVMLNGYESMRNRGADAIDGVWLIIKPQPLCGIQKACGDVAAGRLPGVDLAWQPTTPQLVNAARRYVEPLVLEQQRIIRILGAVKTMVPPADDGAKARVAAAHAAFKRALPAMDALTPEQRTTARLREIEANERAILAEWAALGLDPIRQAGLLVSPSLARRLGLLAGAN